MDNAGVELPCTGSLHSPAIILKIQAIFLKIQAVILKIQAIILTKGVRSRILGRLVTWVLDGIDNSWIFHGHWLDRHNPSTLESQTISGFQSIISGCTKISFLDCTRLWCHPWWIHRGPGLHSTKTVERLHKRRWQCASPKGNHPPPPSRNDQVGAVCNR